MTLPDSIVLFAALLQHRLRRVGIRRDVRTDNPWPGQVLDPGALVALGLGVCMHAADPDNKGIVELHLVDTGAWHKLYRLGPTPAVSAALATAAACAMSERGAETVQLLADQIAPALADRQRVLQLADVIYQSARRHRVKPGAAQKAVAKAAKKTRRKKKKAGKAKAEETQR